MKRAVGWVLAVAGAVACIVPVAVATQTAATAEAASASGNCAPQPVGGTAATAPLVSYTAINPVRLVDTRARSEAFVVLIDRGCTIRVNLGADVPASAQAVALSMTAVSLEADYFTVYPCAAGLPQTSNLKSRCGSSHAEPGGRYPLREP